MENKNSLVWADTPCTTFRYCELAVEQKTPVQNGWQNNTKSFDEVWDAHQATRSNIGLVLGNISGVMDIDCDSVEAVALMYHLADSYLGHFKRSPPPAPLSPSHHVLTRCNRNIVVVSMKVWVDHMVDHFSTYVYQKRGF